MGDVQRPQSWCNVCRGKRDPKTEATVELTFIIEDDQEGQKAVAEMVNDTQVLTTNYDATLALFQSVFPSNHQRYGWGTMAKRLVKKLGGTLIIGDDAQIELGGGLPI